MLAEIERLSTALSVKEGDIQRLTEDRDDYKSDYFRRHNDACELILKLAAAEAELQKLRNGDLASAGGVTNAEATALIKPIDALLADYREALRADRPAEGVLLAWNGYITALVAAWPQIRRALSSSQGVQASQPVHPEGASSDSRSPEK